MLIMLQFRNRVWFLVMLSVGSCVCKENNDKLLDRFVITCHTNDFVCFKLQYKALRDNFLLGNDRFGIPTYEHYVFEYGGGTCVKLTGLEDSELTAISMDSTYRKYTLVIDFPLRILQVKNNTKVCAKPELEFDIIKPSQNRLIRFSGNASINITYPYKLKKKKCVTYMNLEDENLDVTIDIPDLSHFHKNSQIEGMLYEWSEWAYEVVRHVNAAENFALPYTRQLVKMMQQLPLHRFILLYPDEQYHDLNFSLREEP